MSTVQRRQFLKTLGATATALALARTGRADDPAERPNILWLVSEDNAPFLGCYGDACATTPHLDRFASEGLLYLNAIASAPVCAPARCTVITGMYPPTLGTQHMRSRNPIPASVRFFTNELRDAGYYCSNCAKEDYNVEKNPDGCWDESSKMAHYRNRRAGQPFFSVFNFGTSHESSIFSGDPQQHDPARAPLPPYHPDCPEARHDWALYYDRVSQMDRQIGQALAELEKDGLAEDTIVFYFADNGGVLPRSKRFLYDSGIRVPLIVRFPKKWRHLAPAAPGTKLDRVVSYVDFGPTVLSLAGVQVPERMQGVPFLGRQDGPPREYAYSFRGRMDERIDFCRAVRDRQFLYIRNYLPHLPYDQHVSYMYHIPMMRAWRKRYEEGRLDEVQKRFFEAKPTEELYDVQADPHNIRNLADDPKHRDVLQKMRQACRDWSLQIRDSDFLPEGELLRRAGEGTIHDLVRDPKRFDLPRLMSAADRANERKPENVAKLAEGLKDGDSGVRYWAAIGLVALGERAAAAVPALQASLQDEAPDVRVAAAEALCRMGHLPLGAAALGAELTAGNRGSQLHAANALDRLGQQVPQPVRQLMLDACRGKADEYVKRALEKSLGDLGLLDRTAQGEDEKRK